MSYMLALLIDDSTAPATMTPALVRSADWAIAEPPPGVTANSAQTPVAQLSIGDAGVRLTTQLGERTYIIEDDPGPPPLAPPGWWDEVSAAGDLCSVVLAYGVDLANPTLVDDLNQAAAHHHVVTAQARVQRTS